MDDNHLLNNFQFQRNKFSLYMSNILFIFKNKNTPLLGGCFEMLCVVIFN